MTAAGAMETDQTEEVLIIGEEAGVEEEEEVAADSDYVNDECGGRDFLTHPVLLDSKSGHVLTAEDNRVLVFSVTTGQLIR